MRANRVVRLSAVLCLALLVTLPSSLSAQPKRDSRDTWQQPDRVIDDLNLSPGQRVADIGCGGGYFVFRMAKAVAAEGKVYGTEISEKALKSVKDRVERDKLTQIEPVLSGPTDTKLPDACLDAALICNVLHHVPKDQRAALVKDIARSLKPGASLSIVDWRVDAKIDHDKDRRIPRDEFLQLAKDAGLTLDAEFHYLVHQVFLRLRKSS